MERALAVVGDAWTFRILREAFFRTRRFDAFRKATGAAPNILTDRLKKLVENGVFEKVRYSAHAGRFEYRLTEKGRDLYPMIVMLMDWGDKWLADESGPPLKLRHKSCGADLKPVVACSACGEAISARAVEWRAADEDAPRREE